MKSKVHLSLGGGRSTKWGGIEGNLSDQQDLIMLLSQKASNDDFDALMQRVDDAYTELDQTSNTVEILAGVVESKANAASVIQSLSTKADLDESGKVPASQLPSYVDDVLEGQYVGPSAFNDLSGNLYTPESGKVYIDVDTNKTYRWSGMLYVVVGGGGVALGETSSTAYRGDRGKIAYDHSISQGNPHNVTTSEITETNNVRFFKEDLVRNTLLTGLNTTTGGAITALDTHLSAFGKLQWQANNSSSTPITWINATTLSNISWSSIVDQSKSKLEFASFQGTIYLRGVITTISPIGSGGGSPLFTHRDSRFMCDVSFNPNPFTSFVLARIFTTAQFGQPDGQMLFLQNSLGGDNQGIQSNGALQVGVYHLAPVMIGKAKS